MFSNSFPYCELIARTVARMLLEIKAVHFRPDQPFIFTSGRASPVYIDCRKLISYPRVRSAADGFRRRARRCAMSASSSSTRSPAARRRASRSPPGSPTAWRCRCTMCARSRRASAATRRSKATCREGARTLLVEDLTTDGGSKINFCKAMREAGADRRARFVDLLLRHLPGDAEPRSRTLGVRLHYLATWWDVLKVAARNSLRRRDADRSGAVPQEPHRLVLRPWWNFRTAMTAGKEDFRNNRLRHSSESFFQHLRVRLKSAYGVSFQALLRKAPQDEEGQHRFPYPEMLWGSSKAVPRLDKCPPPSS